MWFWPNSQRQKNCEIDKPLMLRLLCAMRPLFYPSEKKKNKTNTNPKPPPPLPTTTTKEKQTKILQCSDNYYW